MRGVAPRMTCQLGIAWLAGTKSGTDSALHPFAGFLRALVEADRLHQLGEPGVLLGDDVAERQGRRVGRPRADALAAILELLARDRIPDRRLEPRDDGLRRALRHRNAAPRLERNVVSLLVRGRHVGKRRIAL